MVGLLVGPLTVLIGIASLYDRFATHTEVRSALIGAAAATAGLVIGNAYKMIALFAPMVSRSSSRG